MRITGTFIDEITHDIPDQSWGPDEWAADFDAMKHIGIDTVIIIRSGYQERAIFESDTLKKFRPMMPAPTDLGTLFLDLAHQRGMKLFWGIYDTGDWEEKRRMALTVNQEFMNEVHEKYGSHPAFAGWYLTFELCRNHPEQVQLVVSAGDYAKKLTPDLPTLISPYIAGPKAPSGEESIFKEQHEDEWRSIFTAIKQSVDIVAFQDGHVDFLDLPGYLVAHARMAKETGIRCWSNVETFDRDMPIKFPPINWRKMEFKLDAAAQAGVDKLITFEFSHFMSPNSCYPSAHNLYKRYCERLGI